MEHLYNPDQMSESEIKQTFVARQPLIDKLITRLEKQPTGAGVQHTVLVAPRGMGKTTILLMLKFSIADRGLDKSWLALRFPEEMYSVNDLADFWLEVVEEVARETEDTDLKKTITKLRDTYKRSSDLEEALLALLSDWCRKHERRLVLLVDNFDLILEQIGSEQADASLRRVLMNEGFLTLIGAAPSFFKEANGYGEPLYNFFRIEHLRPLTYEDMEALLVRRAEADSCPELVSQLKDNTGRLRALEYFTGGNTRLILMLYAVLSQSGLIEARVGLERLLDQVTPFYKAKTETLPPQQRKIIDSLARLVGETHEGITPAEIAQHSRLTPQVVSAQLKRLLEAGYVQVANIRSRRSFYTLSEPLYSLWHQMRFGRDARQRMGWLVSFLKSWYEPQEITQELGRWTVTFRESISAGNHKAARSAVEYRRWLAEAEIDIRRDMEIRYLIKDIALLNDPRVFEDLGLPQAMEDAEDEETAIILKLLDEISPTFEHEKFESISEFVSTGRKDTKDYWLIAGEIYGLTKHYEDAIFSYDRALATDPEDASAWHNRGNSLDDLACYEDAISSYDRALAIDPEYASAWGNRGISLYNLARYEDAISSYDRALAINPEYASAWHNRGISLDNLARYEDAISSYDRALAIDPEYASAWHNRGISLYNLARYEDAISSYDRALAIDPEYASAWGNRGISLYNLARYEDAISSYDRALAINPEDALAWYNRGISLDRLVRYEDAISSYDRALAIDPEYASAWHNRGISLDNLARYEDAISSYDRALAIDPEYDSAWHNRGISLYNLARYENAISSYKRSIGEKKEYDVELWKPYWGIISSSTLHGEGFEILEIWPDFLRLDNVADWAYEDASSNLIHLIDQKRIDLVRQLLAFPAAQERFYPLARALAYHDTRNQDLLEKLAPEMRPIVEEVVAKLDLVDPPSNTKAKS